MSEPGLADKIVALDAALAAHAIPHVLGGALALAYWSEPRATHDVDCNLFVGVDRVVDVDAALRSLGDGVDTAPLAKVATQGQARCWWGRTPLDLFFSYDVVHEAFAASVTRQPFGAGTIPVLSAEALAVCKVVFDRPKDWVDLDALLLVMGPDLDLDEIDRWTAHLLPDGDERIARFTSIVQDHTLR